MKETNNIIIAPSILSANFINLDEDLKKVVDAKVKWIHFDVMDGDFVPNLTFGPKILQDIKKNFELYVDCHMMVKVKNRTIEDYLLSFIKAGANSITMHYEALDNQQLNEFLALKEKYKINIGLAIKPATKVDDILNIIDKLDLILVMTVEPGFGGQVFIAEAAYKIKLLRDYIDQHKLKTLIEVDGGINDQSAKICKDYGVDILVAGSFIFESQNVLRKIKELKGEI